MDRNETGQPKVHMLKRWLRIVAGSFLIVLGVIGLFLPFLQGVLFIVVGLSLLGVQSERLRRLQAWARSRWEHARVRGHERKSAHGI